MYRLAQRLYLARKTSIYEVCYWRPDKLCLSGRSSPSERSEAWFRDAMLLTPFSAGSLRSPLFHYREICPLNSAVDA